MDTVLVTMNTIKKHLNEINMKFITLTRSDNNSVLINPMMITAIVEAGPADQLFNTQVYTIGGGRHVVKETAEEIQKLIKKSERITTTTWETGPR